MGRGTMEKQMSQKFLLVESNRQFVHSCPRQLGVCNKDGSKRPIAANWKQGESQSTEPKPISLVTPTLKRLPSMHSPIKSSSLES